MGDLSLFGSLTAGRIRRLLPCLALVVLAGCGSHQHSFARSNRRPRTPECNGVFTHTTLFQPYEKRLVGVGGRSLGNHRHYLRVSQKSFRARVSRRNVATSQKRVFSLQLNLQNASRRYFRQVDRPQRPCCARIWHHCAT
ncbi:hypothetical protein ELH42_14605 [Rhizobium ruizarguesonis]|uniref:Lipoprotein n=1 Tax=Rhizobium ruizarguesonis TaxID=2081791 RepID=A0AB38I8T2_9HYPH|nr:hypothetical protein ELH85_19395 [Rhizobium ruizarguesonis]TAZ79610.1 hypothetical protein ELH68_18290 [Rhizobium ruizarguesonis]TBA05989.1 hypothetical protein ELH64_16790 [Rhizobium ruizarguesonis]TBA27417.1 hypothetical protein ELH61_17105 [Rhizobium ruizarguesonis]TBA43963.1 hypothetical protein ELH62_16990 [Rhizobium ruizarguesonis]